MCSVSLSLGVVVLFSKIYILIGLSIFNAYNTCDIFINWLTFNIKTLNSNGSELLQNRRHADFASQGQSRAPITTTGIIVGGGFQTSRLHEIRGEYGGEPVSNESEQGVRGDEKIPQKTKEHR